MSVFDGVRGLRGGAVIAGPLEVRYVDTGDGPGRGGAPIVLVHGTGGTTGTHFADLLPMLAFRRRVIGVDLTDPPGAATPTLQQFAAQVEAVIRTVAPGEPVTLLGYSLGAVVATVVASDAPELIDTLVLVAGWLTTDREQSLRNRIALTLHASDLDALAQFLVFTTFGAPYLSKRLPAEIDALVASFRARIGAGPGWRAQMELNRTIDVAAHAYRVQAPALVVGATYDKTAPIHHSRLLFGAIDNSRYVEIASGHGVTTERPAELYWLVEQFTANPKLTPPGSIWHSAPLSVLTPTGLEGLSIPPVLPTPQR
ncbi:alpha/beta fold hydrolase [Dactylosporangium sp. CA-092794]|uniref:alpha/beta fold hydrolase n=1 Tax=Dactylosporangium sp. CA-092794 TaxID=3239929 RepID=UPI003D92ABE5